MQFTKKLLSVFILLGLVMPTASAWAGERPQRSEAKLHVSGLMGTIGSTIGPDGALYVPQAALGKITRIDLSSGQTRTFARGLPPLLPNVGIGGAIDVAFIGNTGYVLVTLVDFTGQGSTPLNGIYRVDGKDSFTIIADLGAFSLKNPPTVPFDYFVVTGVQYALQPIDDGFLVSDGHHNRVLHVTLDGDISVLKQFENVAPTGNGPRGDRRPRLYGRAWSAAECAGNWQGRFFRFA